MNPILKLQRRVWQIRNTAVRRAATIATFGLVVVPAWALFWVMSPLLLALFPLLHSARGFVRGCLEGGEAYVHSLKSEWAEWRERRRVFGVLWAESETEWRERRGLGA